MRFCQKKKKIRPPLKPREGPYKKTNAYTSKPSFQQILTFCLGISVIILHSIFIVAPIIKINNPILFILLGLHYLLVVVIIYVYVKITIFDPVDTFILDPNLALYEQAKNNINMTYCNLCRSFVHQKSYHCKRCRRCTQDFDHHCVFLNNCIGSLNYELFMELLLLYIVFALNVIGQCIWVFVVARSNEEVSKASITEWMAIAIIIFCILQLIPTAGLLGFHCYISCCLDLTTIAFYESQSRSQKGNEGQNRRPDQIDNSPYQFMKKEEKVFKQTTLDNLNGY